MSANTGPITRGSSLRRTPTPHPRTNPTIEEGESGEEELTSYHDPDTARDSITPPSQEPTILDTLRSSLPSHVSSSTNNQDGPTNVLVEGTRSYEIPEPTPRGPLPSQPTKVPTPPIRDSDEGPPNAVLELIAKFVGSAMSRVAQAGAISIPTHPPKDLARFIREEDPSVTITDVFAKIIAAQTETDPAADHYSGYSKDLTRVWT